MDFVLPFASGARHFQDIDSVLLTSGVLGQRRLSAEQLEEMAATCSMSVAC